MPKPYGVPADFSEHFRLMTDMITVAFQADMSRVVTFLVTREGTSRPYREIGIPDGHHPLTHHMNKPELLDKVTRINEYHMVQFAKWMEKLKSIKDGDGTLLDHSLILYGTNMGDSNQHLHYDVPHILIGGAGGKLKGGRHLGFKTKTVTTGNLMQSILGMYDIKVDKFGDGDGPLQGLA